MSVCHVARSQARLRTRCGRLARGHVCLDAEVVRDPEFWREGSALRARIAGAAAAAICASCAAVPNERLDRD